MQGTRVRFQLKVLGSEFRVWGLGVGVRFQGLWVWGQSVGLKVRGVGRGAVGVVCGVWGVMWVVCGVWGVGCGSRVKCGRFWVWGVELRVGVQGSRSMAKV